MWARTFCDNTDSPSDPGDSVSIDERSGSAPASPSKSDAEAHVGAGPEPRELSKVCGTTTSRTGPGRTFWGDGSCGAGVGDDCGGSVATPVKGIDGRAGTAERRCRTSALTGLQDLARPAVCAGSARLSCRASTFCILFVSRPKCSNPRRLRRLSTSESPQGVVGTARATPARPGCRSPARGASGSRKSNGPDGSRQAAEQEWSLRTMCGAGGGLESAEENLTTFGASSAEAAAGRTLSADRDGSSGTLLGSRSERQSGPE